MIMVNFRFLVIYHGILHGIYCMVYTRVNTVWYILYHKLLIVYHDVYQWYISMVYAQQYTMVYTTSSAPSLRSMFVLTLNWSAVFGQYGYGADTVQLIVGNDQIHIMTYTMTCICVYVVIYTMIYIMVNTRVYTVVFPCYKHLGILSEGADPTCKKMQHHNTAPR
jgi:hypothetical protein